VQLTVIVPAFNEGTRIFQNLREIADAVASFSPSWEIILVDDGSTDHTRAESARAQADIHEIRVLSYPGNRGKGSALRTGASEARGEFVVFLDADLELHPKQIPALLRALQETGADLVVGAKRYDDPGHAVPPLRKVLSRVYSSLVRLLFRLPVRDTQSGLKLFRRDVLNELLPAVHCSGFAFDLDLLVQAHRRGYRMAETPVAARFLRVSSRLTLSDALRIWVDTLRLYCRARAPQRLRMRNATNPRTSTGAD
jgi:glycosyltransferase involved in cell wall biosynthesis